MTYFDSWFWKFQPMVIHLVTWSLWQHDSCMAAECVMRYFLFKASRKQTEMAGKEIGISQSSLVSTLSDLELSSRSILLTVLPPPNSTTWGPSRYTWALGNVSDLKDIRCNSIISSHSWQFVRDDPPRLTPITIFLQNNNHQLLNDKLLYN